MHSLRSRPGARTSELHGWISENELPGMRITGLDRWRIQLVDESVLSSYVPGYSYIRRGLPPIRRLLTATTNQDRP